MFMFSFPFLSPVMFILFNKDFTSCYVYLCNRYYQKKQLGHNLLISIEHRLPFIQNRNGKK